MKIKLVKTIEITPEELHDLWEDYPRATTWAELYGRYMGSVDWTAVEPELHYDISDGPREDEALDQWTGRKEQGGG